MNASTPDADPVHRLREQAIEYIRSNRPQAAQEALQALVRMQPQDVPACLELASLMSAHGRYRASSAPLLTAVQHLPRHGPVLLKLAEELITRGEVVAARGCLDFLSQDPGPPPDALVRQAGLRYQLGEIELARDLMQRALAAGADAPRHHHLYAMLLEYSGRTDAAREVLESCIGRWPDDADAVVALVRMCRQTAGDNRLAHVEEQLGKLRPPGQGASGRYQYAGFEYARFKVLDDLGRHAEAWPSLARSNALLRQVKPHDAAAVRALTDALVGMPAARRMQQAAARAGAGPAPIFIVGMPRSGTTLLDRMLSSHSRVVSAGELLDFWRHLHWVADERPVGPRSLQRIAERWDEIDLVEVGARYLEQTRWRAAGHAYYIDKLPANIQMVAFIRRALPHARILNMVRDPMDVCFSNFKSMFGNIGHDLGGIADYHRQHVRLCTHWHALPGDAMLDVSYADLVRDPRSTLRGVLDYCGLQAEEACMHPERNAAPVATPSSSQVRQPIHTRGLGQWRDYAAHLEPLQKALLSQ